MKPSPQKPRIIMAHVESSGTAEATPNSNVPVSEMKFGPMSWSPTVKPIAERLSEQDADLSLKQTSLKPPLSMLYSSKLPPELELKLKKSPEVVAVKLLPLTRTGSPVEKVAVCPAEVI